MNQNKRKLSFKDSSQETTKKSRKNKNNCTNELIQSITSIESLSNEVFYEIFDYLDGCQIYESFSNLNYRFYQLINSSCLLFKMIDYFTIIDDDFLNNWNEIISYNKEQIFSLTFYTSSRIERFLSSSTIQSFIHLQALFLYNVQSDILMSVLINLSSLPHLQSLTINMFNTSINLADIYQLVFNLSMLKYYKLSIDVTDLSISLPIPINEQHQSSIESLIIDHSCTFQQLSTIVSYTLKLRYLKLTHGFNDTSNKLLILPIKLENLTYFSLHIYSVEFHDFQRFIQKINSNLKKLNISIQCQDMTYLHAYQWEQLLLKYFPYLEKFYLMYSDCINNDNQYPIYSGGINQFSTSFWIQRKWILKAQIEGIHIKYVIYSYSKTWYNDFEDTNIEYSTSATLILTNFLSLLFVDMLFKNVKRILTITQIYHLIITEQHSSIRVLVQLIKLLPDLLTLKLRSLSLDEITNLDNIPLEFFSNSSGNHVAKVNIGEINDIEDFHLILNICPFMVYLKVKSINSMDIKLFLRTILKTVNDDDHYYLRSLCFHIPLADDQLVENLHKMMEYEELLNQFTIKRVADNIYLQWS